MKLHTLDDNNRVAWLYGVYGWRSTQALVGCAPGSRLAPDKKQEFLKAVTLAGGELALKLLEAHGYSTEAVELVRKEVQKIKKPPKKRRGKTVDVYDN